MKSCRFCGGKKHLFVQVRAKKYNKKYYCCRSCNTERMRAYRKTPLGKAAVLRATKKYNAKKLTVVNV